MKTNFKLNFNGDCESPAILLSDFFKLTGETIIDPDPEAGITITKVTIQFYKNVCTDGCDATPMSQQVILSTFEASELPSTWTLADNILSIPFSGGIAKIIIIQEYLDEATPLISQSGKCAFVPCDIVCCVIEELFSKEGGYELVEVIQSIQQAIDCNKCCMACDLYMYIKDKLNKRKCKPCS